jgi:hypothetical protein
VGTYDVLLEIVSDSDITDEPQRVSLGDLAGSIVASYSTSIHDRVTRVADALPRTSDDAAGHYEGLA